MSSDTETRHEGRPQRAWSDRHPATAAAVYAAAYLLVAAVGGRLVALPSSALAKGLLITLVATGALALSLLLVLSICRLKLNAAAELGWVLGLLVVFALVRPSVFAIAGRYLGFQVLGKNLAETLPAVPSQLLLANAVLVVWATFLGRLVSRIIREGKLLLPVVLVAAVADIVTVFWGVVAKVSEAAPEVVDTLSTSAPVEVPEGVPAPILTAVGIGDFLFLAVFLALALRYAMEPVRTLWATFVVMLVAPLAFLAFPTAMGLPGLPFIGAAVLWANHRHLRLTREEKRAMVFAGALVAAAAAGIAAVAMSR